ncbi:MAG: pantetheine-phosphate adenylyltransferase [Firmicutes bacterium]|nr:pantetheine-phosphate adenylyltransferase [Bacillota bacterium]
MTKAVFCGTFDPVTLGHVDIIERASRMFDSLVVFVTPNSLKKNLFDVEQRKEWIQKACAHLDNVEVKIQNGLAVDAARKEGAHVFIRGIRNGVDCDYEQNMAHMNHLIDPSMDTVCLFTKDEYAHHSSSNVRELMAYNLDISKFVPACVLETLQGEK